MSLLRILNATCLFAGELFMLWAYAHSAWQLGGPTWARVLLALATPTVVAVVWRLWAAPRSETRLSMPWLLLLEGAVFGGSAGALYWTGAHALALGFFALISVNLALAAATGWLAARP
jgi:hypothetical protein